MQPQQPGYNSSRVYLELIADLPWQKASEELQLDLKAAKERLDSDHYGLVKVKQRIIEYLAVRKVEPHSSSILQFTLSIIYFILSVVKALIMF